MTVFSCIRLILSWLIPTVSLLAQVSWIEQPTATVGELGGAATFSFSFSVLAANQDLGVSVIKDGAGSASSRFTIVSKEVSSVIGTSGSSTRGTFTLEIADLKATDVGNYVFQPIANGFLRTPSSSAAGLSVVSMLPPTITSQPSSRTATVGARVIFSVSATGASRTYQWRKNGINLPGMTASTLEFAAVTLTDAGSYSVVVTNSLGSVTSSNAALTVQPPPSPPIILAQPQTQTVTVGSRVTFTVSASGSAPLRYQWYRNGSFLFGAESQTLTISSAQFPLFGENEKYTVQVSNSVGSVTSQEATLIVIAVPRAPNISLHPVSQEIPEGTRVEFSVVASGVPEPTYQWRKNGVPIPGATQSTYMLSSASVGDSGEYTVLVSNTIGTATSEIARLTVNARVFPPTIISEPRSTILTFGETVTFRVVATGTPSLAYRWLKNGIPIPGATNASLVIGPATPADSGKYRVEVSNPVGIALTSEFQVVVESNPVAPAIVTQPSSITVLEGTRAIFAVVVEGTPTSYQWLKNGFPILGATSSTLTIDPVRLEDAGSYHAYIGTFEWMLVSRAATLTVTPAATPPSITLQPVSRSATIGTSVEFLVSAVGSLPLTYQWFKNGNVLLGQNTPTLRISDVQELGVAEFRVAVTNAAGTVLSSGAILTVTDIIPRITTQPSSLVVASGDLASFSVIATGSNLRFQWRRDGRDLAGMTSATLTIVRALAESAGSYSVVVTNGAGSVASAPAILEVSAPLTAPTILESPQGVKTTEGSPVLLWVTAAGSGPLRYQWFKDGIEITGANSSWFEITSVKGSDSGSYSVLVLNRAGAVHSVAVGVTVLPSAFLSNVSVRTTLEAQQIFIVGLTVGGGSPKEILVRAIGPGLQQFGVPNLLLDPKLVCYKDGLQVLENDNWPSEHGSRFASVGAFPLIAGSKDSSMLQPMSGGYSFHVLGSGPGDVLFEGYDAGSGRESRLINLSSRNRIGPGSAEALIVGFTVSGSGTANVLVRGVGPTLAQFGIGAAAKDPRLAIFEGSRKVAEINDWSDDLAAVFTKVGAFSLAPKSKDSAILLTLEAGKGYTAVLSLGENDTGEAMIEVYEVR